MDNILTSLHSARTAITEAITAIEAIGWSPILGAEGYESNGRLVRHKIKGGYKMIKLSQGHFSAHGKNHYLPINKEKCEQLFLTPPTSLNSSS